MNRSLFNECTGLFVIFLFNFNVYTNDQIKAHDNPVEFSGDFEVFLKDLGSIFNKSKSRPASETVSWKQTKHELLRKTTPSTRSSGKVFNSQKAALNDVLMMKLVSYYEDKYRLAHHESQTAHTITLGDHFDQAKSNKYNVMDVIDTVDQGDGKTKNSDTTRLNLEQAFNFMEPHSSGAGNMNVNQGAVNKPEQVEEVLNVMEYIPPNVGRVQNTVDHTNTNIGRSHMNNRPPSEERIYNVADFGPNFDVVNYEVTNAGKVKIPDFEHQNIERPQNIQESRLSTRHLIRNFGENKYDNNHRVSNIVDYTLPNIQKMRNTLDDRHLPPERIRSIVVDRPRNIDRVQNIPDIGSPEVERVRHNFDNRSPEVVRERSNFKDRSSNYENVHNMDSTRPNVERLRIIIGTSPIDKSTVNMRKSNIDNPISEVIVI